MSNPNTTPETQVKDRVSRLSITVPVELVREDDEYSIIVKNNEGQEASFELTAMCLSPLHWDISLLWAEQKMQEALLKRRRPTGVKDANGVAILEGDIMLITDYNEHYPEVTGLVKWLPEYGAFILQGRFKNGAGWGTHNMHGAQKHTIIGNVFEHPERLKPAVQRQTAA